MKTVYLITTGGTMEKNYLERSGTLLNTISKVERYLKRLRLPQCEIRLISLMNKDSQNMTDEDRSWLAKELDLLLPNENPIVITSGTDTMAETRLYIKRAFPRLKIPVIPIVHRD